VITHKELVDLGELERALLGVAREPVLDQRTMARDLAPLLARRYDRPRLDALRELVNDLVGERASTRATERGCAFDVPYNRLAIPSPTSAAPTTPPASRRRSAG
jgi:hypothetical protein